MKKIILNLFLFFIVIFISLIVALSTIGIKTKKFNNLITNQINKFDNNIDLKLNVIKYKIDINQLSLFFQTKDPQFKFQNIQIPVKNIKVYVDFKSLFKQDLHIKKINLILGQIEIEKLKMLSKSFKPSNFNSFINNRVQKGMIDAEVEVYFDNKNLINNFITKGYVSNLNIAVNKNLSFKKINFNFFADKTDILLKKINGETDFLKIFEGDLKVDLTNEIELNGNFKSDISYSKNSLKYFRSLKNLKYLKNVNQLSANLNNNFFVIFDRTYKLKKYDYKINGDLSRANLNMNKILNDKYFKKKINQLSLKNTKINLKFEDKKIETKLLGIYSLNEKKFFEFNNQTNFFENKYTSTLNAETDENIEFDLLNYKKTKGNVAKLFFDLEKKDDQFKINQFTLKEKENLFSINNLIFKNDKFISFKEILVKTSVDEKINNDFKILYGKKISIIGKYFDATNLPKYFNKKSGESNMININKDIEIDFSNIIAPKSEKLRKFKLIGRVENGKFVKILSKGDFGSNNYLDISMNEDKITKKKYLEIYSDLTNPLLTEYNFFKGLTGGKLLFSAVIDKENTISKLKIENFKVINAPGMIKLLSLADLSGLADLAEGEGLSFDILEIKMEKNNNILKLNEILALGPSISVLMEGYQGPELTSIRGTLIPAKTLNKLISKIPIIGNVVIPKEAGEGLFGISFKLKGPPGNMKTTINPIRTITPRFIQKIVDRKKNSK